MEKWYSNYTSTCTRCFFELNTNVVAIGNDVYVVGGNSGHYFFWKNGQLVDIPQAKEFYDVHLDGQDVYIFGKNKGNEIQIWKNERPLDMTKIYTRTNLSGQFTEDFFVENGNVYLLENSRVSDQGGFGSEISWWKNGQKNTFLTLKSGISGYATDLFVKHGQVFVTGCEQTKDCLTAPRLWRNGTKVEGLPGFNCGIADWVLVR